MLQLTLATLRTQARRLVAPGLATVLGVAFVAVALTLGSTLSGSVRSMVAGYYTKYDTVVSTQDGRLPESLLERVRGTHGVAAATGELTSGSRMTAGGEPAFVSVSTVPTRESLARVEDGRMPAKGDEVAVSHTVASSQRIEVGDTVTFTSLGEARGDQKATVVGVVDAARDARWSGGTPAVFGTHDAVTGWTGAKGYTEIVVRAADGVSPAELTDRVRSSTGGTPGETLSEGAPVVDTGTAHADRVAAKLSGGTDILTSVLLAFALISLFVSALVIANTFAILLARRTRETALLRAVGSTRGQVVRGALVEALVTGVVFSAIGTALGLALSRALVALANSSGGSFPELTYATSPLAVVAPFVLGVVVVVVASLRPVLRASSVAPLEALRPAGPTKVRSRAGLVKAALGTVLVVVGVGLLGLGWTATSVVPGLGGGMLSFVGVLLVGSLPVPAVARGIGAVPARLLGAPGRLAVDNAVANPRRAAATASALLVGVTLVTMTAVAARSAEASVSAELDRNYSVDAAVTSNGGELDGDLVERLGEVDGVTASAPVRGSEVTAVVDGADHPRQRAVGVTPQTREVMRNVAELEGLRDGTAYVSEDTADKLRLAAGDTVTLRGPEGETQVKVVVSNALGYEWAVTGHDLERVDADAPTPAVFLRLADGDPTAPLDRVNEVVADEQVQVGGSAPQRAEMSKVLDAVLYVVLSLLAMSVVIALVGIANTLSLSVLERTQESALLRALGTTRGQLRSMIAIESVLLALVGVVVGTALGIGYGIAGVGAVVGEVTDVQVAIPWGLLASVAGASVLAALLASVLPAVRAARVSPAAALAAD